MRHLRLLSALLALLAALTLIPSSAIAQTASDRPNFLLIMTDDQKYDTISQMPTVSTLAQDSTVFARAIATTPICCPSRTGLLTGQYAHNHGVLANGVPKGGFTAFQGVDDDTLVTALDDAGYRTMLVGKYLNDYTDPTYIPPGWDKWNAIVGKSAYYDYQLSKDGELVSYGSAETDYSTDVLADIAAGLLRRSENKEPFFMFFTPYSPHTPLIPAPRHAHIAAPSWSPKEDFNELDVSDKPAWVQAQPLLEPGEVARDFQKQYKMLQSVDEAVARLLGILSNRGMLDNTWIIYMSDHGESDGAHRWDRKSCPYEGCLRPPLLIHSPKPAMNRGRVRDLVITQDIGVTIADLAGVQIERPIDGVSLVPILNGGSLDRDAVLIETWTASYKDKPDGPKPFEAVRTSDWKYVRYDASFGGEEELYDLKNDPKEMENLIKKTAMAAKAEEMRAKLSQLSPQRITYEDRYAGYQYPGKDAEE